MIKFHLSAVAALVLAANSTYAQVAATAVDSATTAPAAMAAAVAPDAQAQAPQGDADFVAKAAIGGLFEVQSSQLATTKSQSSEIRTFAEQMIADHTKANQELMQLAQSKGIPVPAALDQKHASMMDRLAKAENDKFDTAYGRMQAKAHQEAVTLFQNGATSLTDPDLKAFAAKTLPVLQHHAQMTQSLPGADKSGAKKNKMDHNKKEKKQDQNQSAE